MASSDKSNKPSWKSGKWNLSEDKYKQMAQKREPARSVFKNCCRAFLVGGIICLIGQGIQDIFIHYFHMSKEDASSPTVVVLILVSVILTSFGIYDKLAQWFLSPDLQTPCLLRRLSIEARESCLESAAICSN